MLESDESSARSPWRPRCCWEVRALRTFCEPRRRQRLHRHLLKKYAYGGRSAADVREALDASLAQGLYLECSALLVGAFDTLQPIPTVLWTWACDHVRYLDMDALRSVLRVSTITPRYRKHLRAARREFFTTTPEAFAALVHERDRLFPDWGDFEACVREFTATTTACD